MPISLVNSQDSKTQSPADLQPPKKRERNPALRRIRGRIALRIEGLLSLLRNAGDQLRAQWQRIAWIALVTGAITILAFAAFRSFDQFLRAMTAIGTISVALTVWRTTSIYYANTIAIAERKLRLDMHEKRVPLYLELQEIIQLIGYQAWVRTVSIDNIEKWNEVSSRIYALSEKSKIYFADVVLQEAILSIVQQLSDIWPVDDPVSIDLSKDYRRAFSRHMRFTEELMLSKIQLRDAL